MRKYLPSVRRLAIICFVFALALAGWAKPALSFHKERKIVKQVVDIHKEIQHHSDEGKLDWHHIGEELTVIAKPVRDLGHHDKVDLFKPLEDAVRSEDQTALERAFDKIFFYLMRENIHRSEDSAGNLEKTMTGFIMNARMAYGSLVDKPGSANKQVDRIFQEMEMIAKEAGTMKARMLEKTKELEAQLSGNLGH